jgi:aryl-alcohol dehydrogenase-like predicted oxidoreductase
MGCNWDKVTLGSTGLRVSPLGLGSSYGISARDIERAFDRGINFLFWGLRRTSGFAEAIQTLARRRREDVVVAVQSYSRVASLIGPSVEVALRRAKLDHVDVLTLGWWNEPPPRRIVDAALALRDAGKVRHLAISCHNRLTFADFAADPAYGVLMLRYSAAHPGAEKEVFPHLPVSPAPRPGVLAFTATRWGTLLDPRWEPPGEATPRASDCYRFALTSPHVDACLAGPRNGAELDEDLAALDRGPLDADELAWIKRVGAAVRAGDTRQRPVALLDKAWQALAG